MVDHVLRLLARGEYVFSSSEVRFRSSLHKQTIQHSTYLFFSPVVPAGTIFLRCSTTSLRFSFFSIPARQRTFCLVSWVGSFSADSSNSRHSVTRSTISSGSAEQSEDTTSLGRTRAGFCELESWYPESRQEKIYILALKIQTLIESRKLSQY